MAGNAKETGVMTATSVPGRNAPAMNGPGKIVPATSGPGSGRGTCEQDMGVGRRVGLALWPRGLPEVCCSAVGLQAVTVLGKGRGVCLGGGGGQWTRGSVGWCARHLICLTLRVWAGRGAWSEPVPCVRRVAPPHAAGGRCAAHAVRQAGGPQLVRHGGPQLVTGCGRDTWGSSIRGPPGLLGTHWGHTCGLFVDQMEMGG